MPSTHRSSLPVHPAIHTQPGSMHSAFPASAPSLRLPHSWSTCSLLARASLHLSRCSGTRRERVKPGAAPGRGGAEARGWDPREGARGLGGWWRAHGSPSKRPAAGPSGGGAVRGFPHPDPESKPRRSPGAPAGKRKCSVTPVSALIPPRASGLGEPLDSAWDTGASSSRATGRSLRASAEGPPPPTCTTSRFSPGTGGVTCGLRRGQLWAGRPAEGLPVGAKGLVPLPPHTHTPADLHGWRLWLSDEKPVQDFPSWISSFRGARCTRVWKSGGLPPPLTPS